MNDLINKNTSARIDEYLKSGSHALLLRGPQGAGKGHIAKIIAMKLLNVESLDNYPYFRHIQPVDGSLTIDQIRELHKLLRLKTLGKNEIRRIAVIEDSQYMTLEAQNALLKNLEEPPQDTVIILTAPPSLDLKDTIYSRVQVLQVLPLEKSRVFDYSAGKVDNAEADKIFMLSGGYAGLVYSLINNREHPLIVKIQEAKQLVGSSQFDRLKLVDAISKDKQSVPPMLQALKTICISALYNASSSGKESSLKRWHKILNAVYSAEKELPRNPNMKLLITKLMIDM